MKIKNLYFETLASKKIDELLNKQFSAKTSFWLARLFQKIEEESKHYFTSKQKLIDKHAKKDSEGNLVTEGNGVSIKDPQEFSKDLQEILDIEIDFEMDKIKIDFEREPTLSIDEMMTLLPFIEEVTNG